MAGYSIVPTVGEESLQGTGSWQSGQQDIKMIQDNKNVKFAPLFNGEKWDNFRYSFGENEYPVVTVGHLISQKVLI